MTWYLAPGLRRLREQTNALWPNRSKVSDGSIGDAAHSNRTSDHNPDPLAGNIVRATDTTNDGIDVDRFIAAAIADPRTAYVISRGRIWRNPAAFPKSPGWGTYTGPNAHAHHVHVSQRRGAPWDSDGSDWPLLDPPRPADPEEEIMVTRSENQADMAAAIAPVLALLSAQGKLQVRRATGTDGAYADFGSIRRGLTAAEYAAYGKPEIKDLAPDQPFWRVPLLGPPSQSFQIAGDPVTGSIYYHLDGGLYHVTAARYAQDGRPPFRVMAADSALAKLPVLGTLDAD